VRMGWTPLHTAARDGDMKRLNRCVKDIKGNRAARTRHNKSSYELR
jgi:hypothetical protein